MSKKVTIEVTFKNILGGVLGKGSFQVPSDHVSSTGRVLRPGLSSILDRHAEDIAARSGEPIHLAGAASWTVTSVRSI